MIGEASNGIPYNLMPYITQDANGKLDKLTESVLIYNLGTGKGTSVLQLVHTFEEANKIKILYEIVDRRPGDVTECYADTSKEQRELGWKAKKNILDMCKDTWRFEEVI